MAAITHYPRNRHASAYLLGAALVVLVALTLLFPGLTPWSPAAAGTPGGTPSGVCNVHYYALDAGKESTNAFGPPVATREEAAIKAELQERRLCGADLLGDPSLTAAHYAAWSTAGLTKEKIDFAGIDAFAARLVADYPLWESTVAEMTTLESASAFSLEAIPAGSPSLYMVPNGTGGVTTHQGNTVGNGTAIVFTNGSTVVKLRLDCGFQNVRESFPGVPSMPPGSPEAPKPPTTPSCPPGTTGTPPNCLEAKIPSQDPAPRGNAPVGGGTNADPGPGVYVPPAQMVQPPAAPRVNPAPPAPAPAVVVPVPDPAPAPAPEPAAPAPAAPATGTSCAPGITSC